MRASGHVADRKGIGRTAIPRSTNSKTWGAASNTMCIKSESGTRKHIRLCPGGYEALIPSDLLTSRSRCSPRVLPQCATTCLLILPKRHSHPSSATTDKIQMALQWSGTNGLLQCIKLILPTTAACPNPNASVQAFWPPWKLQLPKELRLRNTTAQCFCRPRTATPIQAIDKQHASNK